MKYVKQLGIIFAITLLAELFRFLIPLPIPASVWGLILMLVLLLTKVIKLEQVKETGDFLVQIMPLTLAAPAVGLVVAWPQLQPILLPVIVILVVTTVVVMVVTGKITQLAIGKNGMGKKEVDKKEVDRE